MPLYNDGNDNYITPAEYFGYTVEHTTDNIAQEYYFEDMLGLDFDTDELTDDGKEAYDELFKKLTELDVDNGNRYWLDLSEDETNALIEQYIDRIVKE